MRNALFILFVFVFSLPLFSQVDERNGTVLHATVIEGDTVPLIYLPSCKVYDERNFRSKREERKYGKLKRDVMAVYPYAKLAGMKLDEYSAELATIESDRKRKKFMKQVEEELEEEFGNELRDLTISQGVILIKLIDRETGDTSYELVKELRGSFSAFFWQSLARIFGHNLKDQYDPEGEEEMIENIVLLIEDGVYAVK